jgi:hypothetical protein
MSAAPTAIGAELVRTAEFALSAGLCEEVKLLLDSAAKPSGLATSTVSDWTFEGLSVSNALPPSQAQHMSLEVKSLSSSVEQYEG